MKRLTKKEEAEKLYKHYLNNFIYPLVGNKTTYLSQLEGAGKKLFGAKFKGVFPSDKIPRLNELASYCILNLDRSTESGSHWIALVRVNDKKSIVYDSFGRNYKKIIPNIDYTGNGRIINSELDSEQKISESDCGARCLSFIMVYDRHGYNMAKYI